MYYDPIEKEFCTGECFIETSKVIIQDQNLPSLSTGGNTCHRVRKILSKKLPKGRQLSVIWGSLTYSSNNNHAFSEPPEFIETPDLVEIAVFLKDDSMMEWNNRDTVVGWVDSRLLNELYIALLAGATTRKLRAIVTQYKGQQS